MVRSGFLACAFSVAITLGAAPALAVPITFYFESGSAQVTATRGANGPLVVDTELALDGVFVTFDPDAPELVDFSLTLPTSSPISMLQVYGGYDTFVVESASITPGAGFSNLDAQQTGLTTYSFLVGPVDVDGVYSASDSNAIIPSASDIPVPFVGTSFLNGSIDTDLMTFELLGITLAELSGGDFGEPDDLIVKADLTWSGALIPEPSSPALFLVGMTVVGAQLRRIRR